MRAYLSIIYGTLFFLLYSVLGPIRKEKKSIHIKMKVIIAAAVVAGKAIIIVFSSDLSEHSSSHAISCLPYELPLHV